MAALLTRMSMRPNSRRMAETARSTSALDETSATSGRLRRRGRAPARRCFQCRAIRIASRRRESGRVAACAGDCNVGSMAASATALPRHPQSWTRDDALPWSCISEMPAKLTKSACVQRQCQSSSAVQSSREAGRYVHAADASVRSRRRASPRRSHMLSRARTTRTQLTHAAVQEASDRSPCR